VSTLQAQAARARERAEQLERELAAEQEAAEERREQLRRIFDEGLVKSFDPEATLAMVLDFAGVQPNPARDRSVKLPREARAESTADRDAYRDDPCGGAPAIPTAGARARRDRDARRRARGPHLG